jgi:hypothetical protein
MFARRMDRESLRALGRVADVPLAVLLAFALALALLLAVVSLWRLMPLGLERVLAVQQHLASGAGPVGGVAVLGSSVVLEGIDCGAVAARLPDGAPCENLAWTGGGPTQWLLLEPALRRSPPRVVVLGLDAFALLHPVPIPAERLAVAAWWDFVPPDERASLRGALSADELAALETSRVEQLLSFRSYPLDMLNERVREVARADLRYAGYPTNFTAPWVRLDAAAPAALARHLEQVTRVMADGGAERLPESERVLTLLVEKARAASPGTRFLFLLTPVHPSLGPSTARSLDPVRRSVASLAERLDVAFSDATGLLAAGDFADAVHPAPSGRAAWSAALGDALSRLLN